MLEFDIVTPKEQNILNALNLLVLLYCAKKQQFPKLSEEQQHTLMITKEHLIKANLTLPVFANTLKIIDEKGYLYGVTIIEDKYHSEIQKFLDDDHYKKIIDEVDKVDLSEPMEKFKMQIGDYFEKKLPANYFFEKEKLKEEKLTFKDLLNNAKETLSGYNEQVISIIILMPFRDVERLLEKMNEGVNFDDIKDVGIWYDPKNYLFHFDEESVSTSYNNKPNKEHFALQALFSQFKDACIDFVEIPEFDDSKGQKIEIKSNYDALIRFVSKHSRLKQIFTVHKDRLEIHEDY